MRGSSRAGCQVRKRQREFLRSRCQATDNIDRNNRQRLECVWGRMGQGCRRHRREASEESAVKVAKKRADVAGRVPTPCCGSEDRRTSSVCIFPKGNRKERMPKEETHRKTGKPSCSPYFSISGMRMVQIKLFQPLQIYIS